MKILRNAIKCNYCGTVVESKYRHDFSVHVCAGLQLRHGADAMIAADGGKAYLRRVGNAGDFEDISETEESP